MNADKTKPPSFRKPQRGYPESSEYVLDGHYDALVLQRIAAADRREYASNEQVSKMFAKWGVSLSPMTD